MNRAGKPLGEELIQGKQNHQQIFVPENSFPFLRVEEGPDL